MLPATEPRQARVTDGLEANAHVYFLTKIDQPEFPPSVTSSETGVIVETYTEHSLFKYPLSLFPTVLAYIALDICSLYIIREALIACRTGHLPPSTWHMAMDPFSVACGATGLASFALDICHEIASYYSAYAAYDSDIQLAYDSVLQLKAILGVINDTLGSPSLDNLDAKSLVTQCISKCRVEIKSLQDYLQRLKKDIPQDEPERRKWIQKLKDKGARLIYPFRKATLGDLRDTVADLRDNLVPALQILTM